MTVIFGVYLGSTSSCIAVCKDGKIEVVANAGGDRVTPAVVGFYETEIVSGIAAKQGIIRNGPSTVQNILRVAGSTGEIEEGLVPSGLPVQPTFEKGQVIYNVMRGEKQTVVTAEKALAYCFAQLKEIALTHTSETSLPMVLSLPSWSSEKTCNVARSAAVMAGFSVHKIISQPAASVMAYNLLDNNKETSYIVVLHCGGITVTGSVVEVSGGLASLKETITTSAVAGDTLTNLIVKHLAKEFYMKYKGDPLENKRSRRKLYNAAENCKHVLSTMASAQVNVESLWEGVDFSTTLSRARFDGIISSSLAEFLSPAKEAVQRSGLSLKQVNKVVLTGGSSKIPKLQTLATDAFPEAEVLFRIPPDEASAYGAAAEAGLVCDSEASKETDAPMVPALALGVFVKVTGSDCGECAFSRGTPTHSRQSLNVPLPSPLPDDAAVIIYEAENSESQLQDENILAQVDLAAFNLETKPIRIDFHLKSDGSLQVSVFDSDKKVSKSFSIEAGGVS